MYAARDASVRHVVDYDDMVRIKSRLRKLLTSFGELPDLLAEAIDYNTSRLELAHQCYLRRRSFLKEYRPVDHFVPSPVYTRRDRQDMYIADLLGRGSIVKVLPCPLELFREIGATDKDVWPLMVTEFAAHPDPDASWLEACPVLP